MGYIIIDHITFNPIPSVPVVVTIAYRLTSSPDVNANYITVSSSVFVNPNGTFVAGPITITGLLDDTMYTIRIRVNCNGFTFKKNIPTVPQGITTTTSTTSTSTSSTTTTTTTVFTCGTLGGFEGEGFTEEIDEGLVRFGTLPDGSTPTAAEIIAGAGVSRNVALDISLNWGAMSSVPTFYWFAIPNTHVDALKNTWFEAVDNQGNMTSPEDLFNAPTTVMVAGNPYHVYITQFATQFANTNYSFRKST